MGRPSTRIRHRSAKYAMRSGRRVSSSKSFGVYEKGFSFTFSHNWNDWKTYTQELKEQMAEDLRGRIAKVAKIVAEEAIKRCPHYSGAMERAIRVSAPTITGYNARGHIEFAVGVLSTWKSDYDAMQTNAGFPSGRISGPELATYIHEMYDTFIYDTKEGLNRKQRKEAMSGATVGSHFLSRAFTENRKEISSLLTTWRGRQGFGSGLNLSETTADSINALLDIASSEYDNLLEQSEVPF